MGKNERRPNVSVLSIRMNFTYNLLQPLNTTKSTYTTLWPRIATKAAPDLLKKEENSRGRYARAFLCHRLYIEKSLFTAFVYTYKEHLKEHLKDMTRPNKRPTIFVTFEWIKTTRLKDASPGNLVYMKYGQPTHEMHDNINPQLSSRIDDGCLSPVC